MKQRIARNICIALAIAMAGASNAGAQCTECVGDGNGDGEVTIDEIVLAVNNALYGCNQSPPTPTPR